MKIVVTGATGLLGWHCICHLHAANCTAKFNGRPTPYEIVPLSHKQFQDPEFLRQALTNSDAVLHFAGVNRQSENDDVAVGNPKIAQTLSQAYRDSGSNAHIVYANSTHAHGDSEYGLSKRRAGAILQKTATNYSDLILPHIFGECARPYYNNVTATLIDQLWADIPLTINPDGRVELLHAGEAAQIIIGSVLDGTVGEIRCHGKTMSVGDLATILTKFHEQYKQNIYPECSDPFLLAMFNSYRAASYPDHWPKDLVLHEDDRGNLFETAKGGGGGQSFVSQTVPGITRGDHFHLKKVERFVVLEGEAMIRIRRVMHNDVWEFKVSGARPVAVDMPTLHTHFIENIGQSNMTTLFWCHDIFDPSNTDTYADKVIPSWKN